MKTIIWYSLSLNSEKEFRGTATMTPNDGEQINLVKLAKEIKTAHGVRGRSSVKWLAIQNEWSSAEGNSA